MLKLIKKIFGTSNERILKELNKIVVKINALEPEMQKMADADFPKKTAELKARIAGGETLDKVLPEAFAMVREASVRTIGLRHFDVQLIGGMVLTRGKIAEMRTGEGKTLVATLAASLNALTGKGVHVITVNDYLAKRDANWMRPIYEFLGLTVGVIYSYQPYAEKKAAYDCDITYGTNNEFGFDYLRDNMVFNWQDKVQRELNFAIIDEVDSILIDEARTPLIISGTSDDSSELYVRVNSLVKNLKRQENKDAPGDFLVDEKDRQVYLSEDGHKNVERLLMHDGLIAENDSLYSNKNIYLMHYVSAALRANYLFRRDVDYIVKNGKVVIVDEHTGRTMEGRRWSDGLHQAVEAKEHVAIQNENQTLASITFQNYFRLYKKLSGMTGTADTEAYELREIYGLDVVVIPTNKPMIRRDLPDKVYMTANGKYKRIIEEIKEQNAVGRPVLVGTSSVENSELISQLLDKEHIKHNVLNAKFHEKEALIIAQAGKPYAVTIATNMAGRGTDIILGGNPEIEIANLDKDDPDFEKKAQEIRSSWQKNHEEVIRLGGLHILGSERHESRRIDNQLRGRAGRQGDPGSSQFYLSLEDNLMRIFASDRVKMIMQKIGLKEDEAIQHPFITKAIENAQRKVENFNFDMRKHLLEYDDIINEQRKIIYEQRDYLLRSENIKETIDEIRGDVVSSVIAKYIPEKSLEESWNIGGLEKNFLLDFGLEVPVSRWLKEDGNLYEETLYTKIKEFFDDAYAQKVAQITPDIMRQVEKNVMLQILDQEWKEHLLAIDNLRDGINLRGYAQQDPKQAYKKEAFNLFKTMIEDLKYTLTSTLFLIHMKTQAEIDAEKEEQRLKQEQRKLQLSHTEEAPERRNVPRVGRNDKCPCGSGLKYKNCCGKLK